MKKSKLVSILIVIALLLVWVSPASAQLGDTDSASFIVQNISGTTVTVTIQFVSETGTVYQPTQLDIGGTVPNPFTLADARSQQINVGDIPTAQLPSGRYSVVISSTGQVVAVATVKGEGSIEFTGGYSSFSAGAPTVYFSTAAYRYTANDWNSMISVQNLGSSAANVTVTITCTQGPSAGKIGTLTRTGIPSMASFTWALKNTTPTGFTTSDDCQGGAVVASTNGQPIAAVNNQNVATTGWTNAFEAVTSGGTKVFLPQLNSNYTNWVSAINILKLGTGNTTTPTITWGDGATPTSCPLLTDSAPSCQRFVPNDHPTGVRTSAYVTSTNGVPLLVSVGSSQTVIGFSGGYNALNSGSHATALPLVVRNYFGWISAINCMNVSTTPTQLTIDYEDVGGVINSYTPATILNEGQSYQIVTSADSHLPDGYLGSAVVTATAQAAQIACMVGSSSLTPSTPGDFTEQYVSLPK